MTQLSAVSDRARILRRSPFPYGTGATVSSSQGDLESFVGEDKLGAEHCGRSGARFLSIIIWPKVGQHESTCPCGGRGLACISATQVHALPGGAWRCISSLIAIGGFDDVEVRIASQVSQGLTWACVAGVCHSQVRARQSYTDGGDEMRQIDRLQEERAKVTRVGGKRMPVKHLSHNG